MIFHSKAVAEPVETKTCDVIWRHNDTRLIANSQFFKSKLRLMNLMDPLLIFVEWLLPKTFCQALIATKKLLLLNVSI